MADVATLHRRVLSQIDRLLAVAEDPGDFPEADTPVSGWTALLHAEHMARADEGALHQLHSALERDDGEGPPLKLLGRITLAVGWIPRGSAKAPETTRPASSSREEVAADLGRVRERVEALGSRLDEIAAARGRASHPVFGGLTPKRWLRFLFIHHHHHLKIIDDIRSAHRAGG